MKKSLLALVAACALMAAGSACASEPDGYPAAPPPAVVPADSAASAPVAPVGDEPSAQAPVERVAQAASFAALSVCLALAMMPAPMRRRLGFRLATHAYTWREYLRKRTYAGLYHMGAIAYVNFPATVTTDIAFGVVGEWFLDGPQRAQPARIDHATAADIVVGRWFTLAADGTARPGGAGAVGGVLLNPKNYPLRGTAAGGPLAPSLVVPTGTIGEFGYMGEVVVTLAAAVAIGDVAKYNTTTGVIGVGAPGAGEAAVPNAKFIRYANAGAGLAVLELTN
jgi:hypothetical protein